MECGIRCKSAFLKTYLQSEENKLKTNVKLLTRDKQFNFKIKFFWELF